MNENQATTAGHPGQAAREFLPLLGQALLTGLLASVAASLLVLGLAATAQAAPTPTPNGAKTGTLLLRTADAAAFREAPRVETEVAIRVTGVVARTRLTQVFHNPGPDAVEGVYVFPLPESAAVDHLWLQIGERRIEGRIQERGEARKTYADAKREGRKAALLEQQRPNLFTSTVAHIGPNDMVRVTLEYQQVVAGDHGEYRLRFPLAVAPRYSPGVPGAEAMPDVPKALEARAAAGEAPVTHPEYASAGSGSANPVDIVVSIDAGSPLASVASSYHDAVFEKSDGGRTIVHLLRDQEAADRDFELTWRPALGPDPRPALFTETVGNAGYALLVLWPPAPTAGEKELANRIARETVLVIDTSGSMEGAPMEQAKAALLAAIDTLRPGDRFNVIEFNSVATALFAGAMPVTPANAERAKGWIRTLKARGGTEMARALSLALAGQADPGVLRQVIFATDGAVGNEEALFGLIGERLGASRLFLVGIGAAPNGHFMTKAAQFGRGTFTYIGNLAEVREKMTQLFAKIEAPVLKDVAIRWSDGTPVETFPERIPDLYAGEPLVATSRAPDFARAIVVSGLRGNQPWSVALTPSPDNGGPSGVGALWARSRIAGLMDQQRTGADPDAIRASVVQVALDHHLVSPYTSLVAVDVTASAAPGAIRTARVPANAPADWSLAMATIPQTDTAATLQILLGLLALAAAGMVAAIGRTMPAAGGPGSPTVRGTA